MGSESWNAITEDGAKLDVELRYARLTPVRQMTVSNVYSGVNAGSYRIYRTDQGADVMRGAGLTDRVDSITFRATGTPARIFEAASNSSRLPPSPGTCGTFRYPNAPAG